MVAAADDKVSDADVAVLERSACPTCGSCSGMFTANSMNCLTEALGLSLPGNGTRGGDPRRPPAPVRRGRASDRRSRPALVRGGRRGRAAARHRHLQGVRERHDARHRHGRLDQHRAALCSPPRTRARSTSPWPTSTGCRAACRVCARSRRRWPTCMSRTCIAPAESWEFWANSTARGLLNRDVRMVHAESLEHALVAQRHHARERQCDARVLPGRARRRADPGRLQPVRALSLARRGSRQGRASATPSTPSPRTAASPCSTAISRSTARS